MSHTFKNITMTFTDEGDRCAVGVMFDPPFPEGVATDYIISNPQPCMRTVAAIVQMLSIYSEPQHILTHPSSGSLQ